MTTNDPDEFRIAADLLQEHGYEKAASRLRLSTRPLAIQLIAVMQLVRELSLVTSRDRSRIELRAIPLPIPNRSTIGPEHTPQQVSLNVEQLTEAESPDHLLAEALSRLVEGLNAGDGGQLA